MTERKETLQYSNQINFNFEFKYSVTLFYLIIILSNISCTYKDTLYKSVKYDITYDDYLMLRKKIDLKIKEEFSRNNSFRIRGNWIESNLGWYAPNEAFIDCSNSNLNRKKPILKRNQFIVLSYSYFISDSTLFEIIQFYISQCGEISVDSMKLSKLYFLENKVNEQQCFDVVHLAKSKGSWYYIDLYYDENLKAFTHWKIVYTNEQITNKKIKLNCLYLRTDDLSIQKDTIEWHDFGY